MAWEKSQAMELDLLEARQDAARDAEPRMEAVVLYGVDTMSTKECMEYFGEYGPSFVEWINDSSRECDMISLPTSPHDTLVVRIGGTQISGWETGERLMVPRAPMLTSVVRHKGEGRREVWFGKLSPK